MTEPVAHGPAHVPPSSPASSAEAAPAAIDVHALTVAYHRKPVLLDVDVAIPAARLTAVIGPNGAGKSTLLKAVVGLVPVASGWIRAIGRPVGEVRGRIAYVPQRESVDWDFPVSVLDVVLMGRYGRLGWLRRPGREDRRVALESLERMGIADLASRQIGQLSGGQQQRAFLARALAQEAELYLMDEPFAAVDAATEQAMIRVLRELRDRGCALVVVHHDLQTVPTYFDHVVMLNLNLVAAGPVNEVFTPENLHRTYGGRLTLLSEAAEAAARGRALQPAASSRPVTPSGSGTDPAGRGPAAVGSVA